MKNRREWISGSSHMGLDRTYLDWYFRLLSVFGMWNSYGESSEKRKLYTCYAVALFCLAGMTTSAGEIIHAWRNKNDLVEFTRHFTLVTAIVSTMAKIVSLWRRRPEIESAVDLLNWERRRPCNRNFAIYRDEIITSTINACRLFGLIFIIMVFWYCSYSYGKDLVYHKGNMNKISISPLLFLRTNETSSFLLLFNVDKAAISYLAGCTACHDSFFVAFLMHVGAQLDLLKRRLESCHDKIDKSRKEHFIEKDDEFHDMKIRSVCRTNVEEMKINPLAELHMCIEHHQTILRYVDLVQRIFNVTLLLQFVTSLLIITMAGFQIFGKSELGRNELIDTVNFLMCALFQLFLYCWFGTEIIAKSESISLSAYKSNWYLADARFKKTLRILLFRGQAPIIFRAGAICELSSNTFMNIISKCYSSMAVLKQASE